MKKHEIATLKLLGYSDTQEDGAILEHKNLICGGYVWHDGKFEDVMEAYAFNVLQSYKKV